MTNIQKLYILKIAHPSLNLFEKNWFSDEKQMIFSLLEVDFATEGATTICILINVLRKDKMAIKTVNISFPQQTLEEIDRFAKKEDLSRSDVIRIGTRKYIRTLREWRSLQKLGEKKMRKLGLKSEEDIVKKLQE